MKKIAFAFGLIGLSAFANAADVLNGTVWQTIDDETKKPKAIVKFTEQKNGTLTASIQQYLVDGDKCVKCEGPYHNKSLKGVTIVHSLKNVGGTNYDNGSILDPKNGKSYSLKAELVDGGKHLKLRGYLGVSLLGRTQVWNRVN